MKQTVSNQERVVVESRSHELRQSRIHQKNPDFNSKEYFCVTTMTRPRTEDNGTDFRGFRWEGR
jgi:hypothetical protein